jgi:hypothetical protein
MTLKPPGQPLLTILVAHLRNSTFSLSSWASFTEKSGTIRCKSLDSSNYSYLQLVQNRDARSSQAMSATASFFYHESPRLSSTHAANPVKKPCCSTKSEIRQLEQQRHSQPDRVFSILQSICGYPDLQKKYVRFITH